MRGAAQRVRHDDVFVSRRHGLIHSISWYYIYKCTCLSVSLLCRPVPSLSAVYGSSCVAGVYASCLLRLIFSQPRSTCHKYRRERYKAALGVRALSSSSVRGLWVPPFVIGPNTRNTCHHTLQVSETPIKGFPWIRSRRPIYRPTLIQTESTRPWRDYV